MVNVPLDVTVRLSPPLSCKTIPDTPLERPVIVPPMERVPVEHVIWIFPTLAIAVPLPLVTVQVCVGDFGWVAIVTLYVVPMAMAVLKVNGLLVKIVRASPPLFCRTRPVPRSEERR